MAAVFHEPSHCNRRSRGGFVFETDGFRLRSRSVRQAGPYTLSEANLRLNLIADRHPDERENGDGISPNGENRAC